MSTVTAPKTARKIDRSIRLLQPLDSEGKNAFIRISMTTARKTKEPKVETFDYWVDRIPADFGEAFLLEKSGDGTGLNEEYHVHFATASDEGQHSCTCPGNTYKGRCKHMAGLMKLRELDLI